MMIRKPYRYALVIRSIVTAVLVNVFSNIAALVVVICIIVLATALFFVVARPVF